jgi:hypothetical protein
MAGVGLFTDEVSAVWCPGFVGCDTSSKDGRSKLSRILCLIFNINFNMAGVGLFTCDLSAVWCPGFVGSDT